MGLKEGELERGYLSGSRPKINSLFGGQAAKPAKQIHLSSYMRFAEHLLGSAASPETSSKNPAAWKCCMRALIRADGATFHQRCNLVKTISLDGREEIELFHTQLDQVRNLG